MLKTLKSAFAIALLAIGFLGAQEASAVPSKINGTIQFDGTAVLNGTAGTATAFTGFQDVLAELGTGDYSGTDGAAVTMVGFTFSPVLSPGVIDPLWNFTSGGRDYSFRLETLTVTQGPTFLYLSGTGYANITGFEETAGTWSLTTQNAGAKTTLTFSASTVVPDGGATAALLGCSFLGLAYVRNRFALIKA